MFPPHPHNWLDGIKRIPVHSLFSLVGIGSRFVPPPGNFIIMGIFGAWRVAEEVHDHRSGADTPAKAVIDAISQVGSAAAGAFIPFHI